MSGIYRSDDIPDHLKQFFEPMGGGNGMRNNNPHPT